MPAALRPRYIRLPKLKNSAPPNCREGQVAHELDGLHHSVLFERLSAHRMRRFAQGSCGLQEAISAAAIAQRAIPGNAPRQPWQLWHPGQCRICNLQILFSLPWFESPSLRHTIQGLASHTKYKKFLTALHFTRSGAAGGGAASCPSGRLEDRRSNVALSQKMHAGRRTWIFCGGLTRVDFAATIVGLRSFFPPLIRPLVHRRFDSGQ